MTPLNSHLLSYQYINRPEGQLGTSKFGRGSTSTIAGHVIQTALGIFYDSLLMTYNKC